MGQPSKCNFKNKRMRALRYLAAGVSLALLAGGCASLQKREQAPAVVDRVAPPTQDPAATVREGSLWSEAGGGLLLYRDRRASRVGDIITVRIVEDPEAELEANTKTSRSSSLAAKLKFLGYMKALGEKNPRLAQTPGESDLLKSSLAFDSAGKGTSDRGGHVKAYVTALVVEVWPNGNLQIKGKREIRVNNETQYLSLSGTVRPEDINQSNEISSVYVANAEISYSGSGPLADKQKPGWLGRALDHAWPF